MRCWLGTLTLLLAFPALAALDGPASPPAVSCPRVLVTHHLYRWNGGDLSVPATLLPRLSVRVRNEGLWGWSRRPARVEVRFDGNVLATFGFGDRDALDANVALNARFRENERGDARRSALIADTALAWNLEIARARLAGATLQLLFKSGDGKKPEEIFYASPSSRELVVDVGEVRLLDVTWIAAPDPQSPTVLLRHRRKPIFAFRLDTRWEIDGKLRELRADLDYALAKGLPLTIRQTGTTPLKFKVDVPRDK